jgi:hypothetical protein
MLLKLGARVVKPIQKTEGAEKGKGRVWYAEATLQLPGYTIELRASFHGGKDETDEVAQAHLNVYGVVNHTKAPVENRSRASYGILLLDSGIYICDHDLDREDGKLMRELCNYNTNLYMGVPTPAELTIIYEVGYRPIIKW